MEGRPVSQPPWSEAALAEAFARLYPAGGAVRALARVPQSFSHDVWRVEAGGGRFALKVARVQQDPARLVNEVAALRLVAKAGVLAPRIVAVDDGGRLYVQEWLPGEDADAAWPALPPAARERYARGLGQALARVHAIRGPGIASADLAQRSPGWAQHLQDYLAGHLAHLRATATLPAAMVEAAAARLEPAVAALPEIAPSLTHWDLWPGNTLVVPHGAPQEGTFSGLLDWESAAFSDPLADFVRLENWFFEPHPETRAPFLAAYWGAGGPPPGAEQRLHVYRGLLYLGQADDCARWGLPEEAAVDRARLEGWLRA
jgi:aminoglycoside phosphotransferase (APT) family kinase protein